MPVVVVAGAAPAWAASGSPVTVVIESLCTTQNGTRLRMTIRVQNPTGDAGSLTLTGGMVNSARLDINSPTSYISSGPVSLLVLETANPNVVAGQTVTVSLDYSVVVGSRPRAAGTSSATLVTQARCSL